MQNSPSSHHNASSPKWILQLPLRRMSSMHSKKCSGQSSSLAVFPEKRSKAKVSKQSGATVVNEDPEKLKTHEHGIDIVDEKSDLLGYDVFHGKLALYTNLETKNVDEQMGSKSEKSDDFNAKLMSKALTWGSQMLFLEDVVSVSYNAGVRHFTLHAYPIRRKSGISCFSKPQRIQRDFCFLASNSEEAIQWVQSFADQQCYINLMPHPMVSGKKQPSDFVLGESLFDIPYVRCKSPPSVLVILNPRSGHGRSSKVFHGKVEPIFKLAGFKMEIVKTTYAGHARDLARNVDLSTCHDGIICVGGDGIVNEVLNGLLRRDDQKAAISVPIGIIPAGSDNSLVWTVLGVRDPISAALTIVKGGLTALDVFAVQWIQTGAIHFGTTVSYFGFLGDVLELSEKYQKRFGPLRYFIAGFLKFLCLPKYSFELEYLPMSKEEAKKALEGEENIEMSVLYTDIMSGSRRESMQRASSLSSIDSIMTPSRMLGGDFENTSSTIASSEPSEYVRGLDPKLKRLSLGRNSLVTEPDEVLHPQPLASSTSNWPRTRSKSRTDKNWTGLTITTESRGNLAATTLYDKEDISSTVSDPGPHPIWDSEPKWDVEPKWDAEPNWDAENPIELPGPLDDIELGINEELVPSLDDKWVVKKGKFLGILVCNHSCRTVQSLSSQVIAPKAVHDDNSLDLLLVNSSGRFRLLRFFVLLQFGRHLTLPYVDYIKVKSVKIRTGMNTHSGCGIDGELLRVEGQVMSNLLPEQCRLMGRPARVHI